MESGTTPSLQELGRTFNLFLHAHHDSPHAATRPADRTAVSHGPPVGRLPCFACSPLRLRCTERSHGGSDLDIAVLCEPSWLPGMKRTWRCGRCAGGSTCGFPVLPPSRRLRQPRLHPAGGSPADGGGGGRQHARTIRSGDHAAMQGAEGRTLMGRPLPFMTPLPITLQAIRSARSQPCGR